MNSLGKQFSMLDIVDWPNLPLTLRSRLFTGYYCSYRCKFCYYLNKTTHSYPLNNIELQLNYLYSYGVKDVELSGGESAERKDWFQILELVREKGMRNICVITNGSRFSDKEYLQRSVDAGLNEILFSLHHHDEISHVGLTGVKTSFSRLMRAMENAHNLGIKIRINTTVYSGNYKTLPQIALVAMQFDPLCYNFLPLNNFGFLPKDRSSLFVDYNKVSPYMFEAYDILSSISYVTTRYFPFCMLKNYEKHICSWFQLPFDIYDWNPSLLDLATNNIPSINNKREHCFKRSDFYRRAFNRKSKECTKCKLFLICDGVEHRLADRVRVNPYPKENGFVVNPMLYREEFYTDIIEV